MNIYKKVLPTVNEVLSHPLSTESSQQPYEIGWVISPTL